MKKVKIGVTVLVVLAVVFAVSGYTDSKPECLYKKSGSSVKTNQKQTINLFVTHGHCSTPFAGIVDELKVKIIKRSDGGNPLENMEISFEIDPNSFNCCAGDELTTRIKTPGVFISENNEKIVFKSTNVYTMGIDWYQVNGVLSIKGVEKELKLFATGIRDSEDAMSTSLVFQGQLNLLDWGIDYDKIVYGKSDSVPTKWMYLNMKVDLS